MKGVAKGFEHEEFARQISKDTLRRMNGLDTEGNAYNAYQCVWKASHESMSYVREEVMKARLNRLIELANGNVVKIKIYTRYLEGVKVEEE